MSTQPPAPIAAADEDLARKVASHFQGLTEEMDRHVIGHQRVKDGLLLGLLAREHIYIEGPPGMAKTMLSEIVSKASDLKFYFYQFHRDTRLAELVGDVVIEREPSGDKGEVIMQAIRRGGVLTAELCVLDDISRAPGEALNVLLRILNERDFLGESLPLLTAIATSNPTQDDYYNEPLDPANLDRFTIQLRSAGLIQEGQWEDVARVIALYSGGKFSNEIEPLRVMERTLFDDAYALLHKVVVSEGVKRGLIDLLKRFVNQYKLDSTNSLISDRSFLVKALKIIKAYALSQGRTTTQATDLYALTFITAFRLPEDMDANMPALIKETIRRLGVAA